VSDFFSSRKFFKPLTDSGVSIQQGNIDSSLQDKGVYFHQEIRAAQAMGK